MAAKGGLMEVRNFFFYAMNIPLMTAEAFAQATGLPLTVLESQIQRGYWPTLTIGKRRLLNVEAIRERAKERGETFDFLQQKNS